MNLKEGTQLVKAKSGYTVKKVDKAKTELDKAAFPGQVAKGLTKREYFAAAAMQGILAAEAGGEIRSTPSVARLAIETADALIEALNED